MGIFQKFINGGGVLTNGGGQKFAKTIVHCNDDFFRIQILLNLGHCFAKINKWGDLINKCRGVEKIFEN